MRRIRTASFISIDGVMQAPGGPEEDPTGGFAFGGWVWPHFDEAAGGLMGEAMGEEYDLLLGRRTYEIFAAYWPFRDDAMARTFNSIRKYVAAGPDTALDWANSRRLEGDLAEAVARLKSEGDRDLLIQGSSEVIHTLLAADLIDEMVTLTFPILLGPGKRLFDAGAAPRAWTLVRSLTSATGVVVSTYRRAGDVPVGSFVDQPPSDAELARRERWANGDA